MSQQKNVYHTKKNLTQLLEKQVMKHLKSIGDLFVVAGNRKSHIKEKQWYH